MMAKYAENVCSLNDNDLKTELWKVINEKNKVRMKLDVLWLEANRRKNLAKKDVKRIEEAK